MGFGREAFKSRLFDHFVKDFLFFNIVVFVDFFFHGLTIMHVWLLKERQSFFTFQFISRQILERIRRRAYFAIKENTIIT